MVLIKLVIDKRRRRGKSGTYMWTAARTHAEQWVVFFSSGVACIHEHLADMWRGREREGRLFCFPVLLAWLFVGE